eukprot:3090608-Pleurochrysis_carterae.AAC.1
MVDQTKIADLHGEVFRNLYPNVPNFEEMPQRHRSSEGWANKTTNVCASILILTTRTTLLASARVPRRAAAFCARMERTAEVAAPCPNTRRLVDIAYVEGQREKLQRWYYEHPLAVATEQRTAERTRPKINKQTRAIHTPFKMLIACGPPDYSSTAL